MRKLALVALASLPFLGGCVATVCDVPTVTISWTLQDTNGNPWGCARDGVNPVSYVDVYLDGSLVGSAPCSAGGGVFDVSGFSRGTHLATVEGVDSVGTYIYDRDQFSVSVPDCGVGASYPAVLAEGTLNLDYHFGTPGTAADLCYAAGSSMWFYLRDEVSGQPLSVIDTGSSAYWKTAYPCGDPSKPVEFSVPYGSYTLLGIQEVSDPLGISAGPLSVAEACGAGMTATVDHTGVTYLTPPYLVPPAAGAPVCYTGAAP